MSNTGSLLGHCELRIKLGGWLLDCICESSNWFMTQQRREGRKTFNDVVPTPEFMEIKDQVLANAEIVQPASLADDDPTKRLDPTKHLVVTCLTRLCVVITWYAGRSLTYTGRNTDRLSEQDSEGWICTKSDHRKCRKDISRTWC